MARRKLINLTFITEQDFRVPFTVDGYTFHPQVAPARNHPIQVITARQIMRDNRRHKQNAYVEYTYDGILVDDHKEHILDHVTHNNKLGFLFNLNNSFGWNVMEEYHPLIKKVTSYNEIITYLLNNISYCSE